MNVNDICSYDDMEQFDDMERDDFDRELKSRDLQRVDNGGGYTIGWLFAANGERLDDPSFADTQPAANEQATSERS